MSLEQKFENLSCRFEGITTAIGKENAGGNLQNEMTTTPAPSLAVLAIYLLPYKVGWVLLTYVKPVIFATGLVGNTLSLLVMLQKQNRRISCCIYMASLAITDNLSIILSATLTFLWFDKTGWKDNIMCGLIIFLTQGRYITHIFYGLQSFMVSGVFIVVAMTVDRFIAVCYPLQSPTVCTVKHAKNTCVIICICSLTFNIPQFLYAKGLKNNKGCEAMGGTSEFAKIFSWFSIIINSALPFATLIILNIMIIRAFHRSRNFMKKDREGPSHSADKDGKTKNSNQKDRQLTLMLMSVSFALLTLTLPQYLRYVVLAIIPGPSTPLGYAYYYFTVHGTSTLFFANNACNFFLYCIGGSKFRQELSALCPCKKVPLSQHSINPSTQSLNESVSKY